MYLFGQAVQKFNCELQKKKDRNSRNSTILPTSTEKKKARLLFSLLSIYPLYLYILFIHCQNLMGILTGYSCVHQPFSFYRVSNRISLCLKFLTQLQCHSLLPLFLKFHVIFTRIYITCAWRVTFFASKIPITQKMDN